MHLLKHTTSVERVIMNKIFWEGCKSVLCNCNLPGVVWSVLSSLILRATLFSTGQSATEIPTTNRKLSWLFRYVALVSPNTLFTGSPRLSVPASQWKPMASDPYPGLSIILNYQFRIFGKFLRFLQCTRLHGLVEISCLIDQKLNDSRWYL